MRYIFILLFVIIPIASAQVGFICPDSKIEILKKHENGHETIVIKNILDGTEIINPHINLPTGSTTRSYQERYGVYYFLMAEAQVKFPYMPELVLLYHINSSTKQYRKGFKAFEAEGEAVQLNNMYCNAFIEAINQF